MARSVWKGPFVDLHLLKKAEAAQDQGARGPGEEDREERGRDGGGRHPCRAPGESCHPMASLHWLIQPTVRATANSTVNMSVGKPIAFSVMPE